MVSLHLIQILQFNSHDDLILGIIILNFMENQFSNFTKEQSMYTFLPFLQYYNPKMYSVFNVCNNLEETNTHVPKSPEVPLFLSSPPPHSSPPPQQSLLALDEGSREVQRVSKREKVNRRKQNEEYRPYERNNRKKSSFLKENRNVLPIKIRQMLSFLTREKKSLEIIAKYIQLSGINFDFSEKRFYAFLKMKKEKVGNYVTLSILKNFLGVQPEKADLYPVTEQALYLKLVRVVFRYYILNNSPLCSLTSTRIQSDQKIEHVRVQRELMHFLQQGMGF